MRVALHVSRNPEHEIAEARERCGLSLKTGRRQERAFGLLRKVHEKRAVIRGPRPIITTPAWASEPANGAEDEYGY